MIIAISGGVTLLVSLALPRLLKPLLSRFGVVDVPNERSSHTRPTVRGVGLAPLLAIIAGYLVLLLSPGMEQFNALFLTLVGIAALAALLGWVEDVRGVPVAVRAGLQLLIGIGGAVAACALTDFTWWFVPVFAVGIAGYINVANFMDGVNGISGLHGVVVGVAYAVLGALTGESWMIPAGLIIAGAFAGFLPWNMIRGSMFLGDVGSYLLGGGIAITACVAIAHGVPVVAVLAPLAIYLADAGVTLLKRVARGERWFEAHRSHVYQRLVSGGRAHASVAVLIAVFSALAAAAGLLSLTGLLVAPIAIGVVGAVVVAYLALPRVIGPLWAQRAMRVSEQEEL